MLIRCLFLLFTLQSAVSAACNFQIRDRWAMPSDVISCYRSSGKQGAELEAEKSSLLTASQFWADVYALEPWLNDRTTSATFGLKPHDLRSSLSTVSSATTEFDALHAISSSWAGCRDAHTTYLPPTAWQAWMVAFPAALANSWDDGTNAVRYILYGYKMSGITGTNSLDVHDAFYGTNLAGKAGQEIVAINGGSVFAQLDKIAQEMQLQARTPSARVEMMRRSYTQLLVATSKTLLGKLAAGDDVACEITFADGSTVAVHWLALGLANSLTGQLDGHAFGEWLDLGKYAPDAVASVDMFTNYVETTSQLNDTEHDSDSDSDSDSEPELESDILPSARALRAVAAPAPFSDLAASAPLVTLAPTAAKDDDNEEADDNSTSQTITKPLASQIDALLEVRNEFKADNGVYKGSYIVTRAYKNNFDRVCVMNIASFSGGSFSTAYQTFTDELTNGLKALVQAGCGNPNNQSLPPSSGARIFVLNLAGNGGGYMDLFILAVEALFGEERIPGHVPVSGRTGDAAIVLLNSLNNPMSSRFVDSLQMVCPNRTACSSWWRQPGNTTQIKVGSKSYQYTVPTTFGAPFAEMAHAAAGRTFDELASANSGVYTTDDQMLFNAVLQIRKNAGYRYPSDGRNYAGATFHARDVYIVTGASSSASAAAMFAAQIAAYSIGTVVQTGGNFEAHVSSNSTASDRGLLLPGLVPGGNVIQASSVYSFMPSTARFAVGDLHVSSLAVLPPAKTTRTAFPGVSAEFVTHDLHQPVASLPPIDTTDTQLLASSIYTLYVRDGPFRACGNNLADHWPLPDSTFPTNSYAGPIVNGYMGRACRLGRPVEESAGSYCVYGHKINGITCEKMAIYTPVNVDVYELPSPTPNAVLASEVPNSTAGWNIIIGCLLMLAALII